MPNWIDTVNLIGAAQGLFLAAVLAFGRAAVPARRWLAVLMLLFSVDLAESVYHGWAIAGGWPGAIGLTVPLSFLYGPVLLGYVASVTARPLGRRSLALQLIPFAATALLLVPFVLLPSAERLAVLQNPVGHRWAGVLTWTGHAKFAVGMVYLGIVLVMLRQHTRNLNAEPTAAERGTLRWLRNLLLALAGLVVVALLLHVYGAYVALVMTAIVYGIGYFGLTRTPAPEASAGAPEPVAPRYARSGLGDADRVRLAAALRTSMERDRLYRSPDLTLADLAAALACPPHHVTEVLNKGFDRTFYDFINGYRIEEVKARLADPASANLTVLAVALEAGFGTKSSFNEAFKRHTGQTPSAYRKHATPA